MPPKKAKKREDIKWDFNQSDQGQFKQEEETKVYPYQPQDQVRTVQQVKPEPSPFDEYLTQPKKKVQQYRQVTEQAPKLTKEELELQQQALLYFEEQKKQHAQPPVRPFVQQEPKQEKFQYQQKSKGQIWDSNPQPQPQSQPRNKGQMWDSAPQTQPQSQHKPKGQSQMWDEQPQPKPKGYNQIQDSKQQSQGQAKPKAQETMAPQQFAPKHDPKMLYPEVKEDIRIKLKQEYDGFQAPAQLSYEDASTQLLRQIGNLQSVFSEKSRTPDPQTIVKFGKEAIQPLSAPLKFSLAENAEGNEIKTNLTSWDHSAANVMQSLLMREQDKVTLKKNLAPLFECDLNTLKRQAACDALKTNAEMREMQIEFMGKKLQDLQSVMTADSPASLSPVYLDSFGLHSSTSGQLVGFTLSQPPEVDRTADSKADELDQQTIVKQLMDSQLDDDAEIDQLLTAAIDPFIEFEEQDETKEIEQVSRFLKEFTNIQADQVEKDKALQKRQQTDHEHHLAETQQKVASEESQEEEDSELVIDTSAQAGAEPRQPAEADKSTQPQDEIDKIVDQSDAYKQAVEQTKLTMPVQIENPPQVEKQARGTARLRMLNELANKPQDNWVVTDSISVKNWSELVPCPALTYKFELDDFQKRAIYRLENNCNVMVAAHTSAGKTVVAEYAIALSRRHMTKTIYTAPIKSLSNQKYRDFKLRFGDVGVVTGDVQLNVDASCLIMTTEVLQSMLYNNSNKIQDVEWVIFDEVHYINDEERGSVWEEVIMKLPDTVSIVMLSATVPNYLEFANWVGRTKQKKVYVQYTQYRPVPLEHHALVDGQCTLLKAQGQSVNTKDLKLVSSKRFTLTNKSQNYSKDEKQKIQDKNSKEIQNMIKDTEKNKKVDFKEKAIMAKEGAIKKFVANAQKTANAQQNGPNAGQKKFQNFQKSLLNIEKMKLMPIIVFAFSRQGCLDLAESLEPQISFTNGFTKTMIMKFIKQKLQRLDEKDRELPQIKKLSALLVRGIGVHHAGLLQILKEIVEILFSDGYLKVVFATSTFAIGLNLPARSVLFTQLKKFDGTDMATMTTSEYLQMAGRAGRRGKDEMGFSLISFDPEHGKIPSNQEITDLLESQGVTLESKLKVDYLTCLNVFKQDEGDIGSLLENSFFANSNQNLKLQNIKMQRRIEPLYERSKQIECIHSVPEQIGVMYKTIDELWEVNWKLNEIRPPTVLQVVQVTSAKHVLKNMIVLRVDKSACLCLFAQTVDQGWPIQYEESAKDFKSAKQKNKVRDVFVNGKVYQYEYTEIGWDMICKYYKNIIPNMDQRNLHFMGRNELNINTLKAVLTQFDKIESQLVEEQYLVNKKKKLRKEYEDKQQAILQQIRETKCFGCDQISYHLTQYDVMHTYKHQLEDIQKVLSGGLDEKETEFNSRTAVLQQYKIVDNDLNLLFKGKVAVKVHSGDCILLTEFFFSGLINELDDKELLAILSIFNNQQRAAKNIPECSTMYSEAFKKAYQFCINETDKLINLEQAFGVNEEKKFERRLNFHFFEAVYDWADGGDFIDIIDFCGIEEGIMIRMFTTLDKIRQQMGSMAKVVGDNALAQRLENMKPLLDRGIVKMQSLYLEVEMDQPKQELDEEIEKVILQEESKDE